MKQITLRLDGQAKRCATNIQLSEAELVNILSEMRKENSYIELGCQGVWDYCFKVLKFSPEQANYYKRIVITAESVPELKAAIVAGTLSVSTARRIVPVVTNENLNDWIEKSQKLSQVELEKAVSIANPNAKPREKLMPIAPNANRLDLCINDTAHDDAKVLLEILSSKLKRPATLSEVVELALQITRDKLDPERKAARSISSGNRKPPMPGRQVIPAGVRHDVIRRQGNQCARVTNGVRCDQTRWLNFHHILEVRRGGLNTGDNIELICSAHHRHHHKYPPHQKPNGQVASDPKPSPTPRDSLPRVRGDFHRYGNLK